MYMYMYMYIHKHTRAHTQTHRRIQLHSLSCRCMPQDMSDDATTCASGGLHLRPRRKPRPSASFCLLWRSLDLRTRRFTCLGFKGLGFGVWGSGVPNPGMGEGLQVCTAIRRLLVLTLPGDDRVSFLPVSQVKIGFFRKTLNPKP